MTKSKQARQEITVYSIGQAKYVMNSFSVPYKKYFVCLNPESCRQDNGEECKAMKYRKNKESFCKHIKWVKMLVNEKNPPIN